MEAAEAWQSKLARCNRLPIMVVDLYIVSAKLAACQATIITSACLEFIGADRPSKAAAAKIPTSRNYGTS